MFEVQLFSDITLFESLKNNFVTAEKLKTSVFTSYLCLYLSNIPHPSGDSEKKLKKIIVIEKHYISQSYIDDYVAYYASGFRELPKFTKRVHFFWENEFFNDTQSLTTFLKKDEKNEGFHRLSDNYIGYVVVKPLRYSIIGATLLRPFPALKESGVFINSKVDENVNFFGVNLKIESLAMQQQDNSVGLCATNALWSALHYTWVNFRTPMLSPGDITKRAEMSKHGGRLFPLSLNSSYDNIQISRVINSVGLDPELYLPVDIKTIYGLKRLIYGYNRSGLPILLGYSFKIKDEPKWHLVTVAGYKIDYNSQLTDGQFSQIADQMSELYVHDDQFGPFAYIKFDKNHLLVNELKGTDSIINNREGKLAAFTTVIIPVLPSIRVNYFKIEEIVAQVHKIIRFPFKSPVDSKDEEIIKHFKRSHYLNFAVGLQDPSFFRWEIYLSKANEYKKDIMNSELDTDCSFEIKTSSYPKYIWVARLHYFVQGDPKKGSKMMDIVFDSTGSPDGFFIYQINYLSPSFRKLFLDFCVELKNITDQNEKVKRYYNLLPYALLELLCSGVKVGAKQSFEDYNIGISA